MILHDSASPDLNDNNAPGQNHRVKLLSPRRRSKPNGLAERQKLVSQSFIQFIVLSKLCARPPAVVDSDVECIPKTHQRCSVQV